MLAAIESGKELKIDSVNSNNEAPLHLAIIEGHADIAIMLIELGAILNIKDKHHQTPIMLSCEKGMSKVALKIALLDPSLIEENNILGENAIKIAQRNKNEELSILLINNMNDRPVSKSKKSLKPISN